MKYLILNDIEYLIHKKWKIILILLFIPFIFFLININTSLSGIQIIHHSMGTNFDVNNYSLMELIIFVFNITISLFIVIDIYSKDIDGQLDNIFLRIKPEKWYLKKSICFCISILFIKIVQYLFISLFLILFGKNILINELIGIFFSEYIYVIFIQYLFLLLYFISILIFKTTIPSIIIFLFFFVFIPKSIVCMLEYGFYAIIIIIIINIINAKILQLKNKKIIEKL